MARSCLRFFCLWSLDRELFESFRVLLSYFGYPPVQIGTKWLLRLCVVLWSPDFSEPQFPYLILSRLSIKSCEQDLKTLKPCCKCKVGFVTYGVLEGEALCSVLGLCISVPSEEQHRCEYYGISHLVEELDYTVLGGAGEMKVWKGIKEKPLVVPLKHWWGWTGCFWQRNRDARQSGTASGAHGTGRGGLA